MCGPVASGWSGLMEKRLTFETVESERLGQLVGGGLSCVTLTHFVTHAALH